MELPDETVTRQIGFRTIELLTDKDEAGSRFAFRINGREIFAAAPTGSPQMHFIRSPAGKRPKISSALRSRPI